MKNSEILSDMVSCILSNIIIFIRRGVRLL